MPSLWRKLRFRLAFLLLCASLLPVLILGALTVHLAQGYLRQAALRRHEAVVDGLASSVELLLAQRMAQLETLASDAAVQGDEPAARDAAVSDFLCKSTFFIQCGVYDLSGKALPGALPATAALPRAPLVAAVRRAALERRSVRTVASLPDSAYRAQLYVAPVRAFSEPALVVGAVAAAAILDSTDIQEILNSSPPRPQEYLAILDSKGEILARHGEGLPARARRFTLPGGLEAARPSGGARAHTYTADNAGRRDLISFSFSEQLGGFVVSGQPETRVFELARTLRENFAVIALLALLASLAASVYLSEALSRPVADLARGIDQLREGVLSHRLEPAADDDLGDAAGAFNALARMLQKRVVIAEEWEKLRDRAKGGP